MTIKHQLLAISFALAAAGAWAESVELLTAGTLGDNVADRSATTLTVTGPVNAADFDFISSQMPELTSLDLSGATVEAYAGKPVLLKRTDFPANVIPDFALAGTKIETLTLPASVTAIGEGALSSSALTTFAPAEGTQLAVIGDGAFSNCARLESVTLPASVTSIGANAFSRCSALEYVTLAGVAELPQRAFYDCPKLWSVTLPGALSSIGSQAFAGCVSLADFEVPAGLRAIGASAFEGSGLTEIDMSHSQVASIGAWAFAKCPDLTTVTFSDNTAQFGEGIFFEDLALRAINLPAGVSAIPDYAFKGDNQVDTTRFLHNDITEIGNYSLMGFTQVSELTLPSNLEYIGDGGMEGWVNLMKLNAYTLTEVPELGKDVWAGIPNSKQVKLFVGPSMGAEFQNAPQWQDFTIEITTGIDEIPLDPASGLVKAWFEGTDLRIVTTVDIDAAQVYDLNGRLLVSVNPGDCDLTVDTAGLGDRLYIIRLALADGTPATVKIAR